MLVKVSISRKEQACHLGDILPTIYCRHKPVIMLDLRRSIIGVSSTSWRSFVHFAQISSTYLHVSKSRNFRVSPRQKKDSQRPHAKLAGLKVTARESRIH